jgi:hypothetical protein
MKETKGNTITIQAKLSNGGVKIHTAEVRAVDPTLNPPPRGGLLWWIISLILWMIRAILRLLFGNVLGEVKAKWVTFLPNGETNFESFELQNVRIWSAGVGARTTTWRWQYRVSSTHAWMDFDTSSHRIYVLLEVPKSPWQQAPYNSGNTELPWTDVMDYACRWAFLAATLDDAATRVTRNIYNLGPSIVEYDCVGGGSSHYSAGNFNCTAFLELLRGGIGNGRYVNCSDCATFVSSFANILGFDLWQSRMGYSFQLNPILAIGSNVWQPACGWSAFSYHEVAWKGACTSNEAIFDACLQVDGDADPTSPPHTPLLPTNLLFGNTGQMQYRDRLATPAGRPNCNPQPATRQHRTIM